MVLIISALTLTSLAFYKSRTQAPRSRRYAYYLFLTIAAGRARHALREVILILILLMLEFSLSATDEQLLQELR